MSSISPKRCVANGPPSLSKLLIFSHLSLATIVLLSFAGVMFWMNYQAIYAKVESELLGAAKILDEQLASGTVPQLLMIPDAFFHRFGKADRDHGRTTIGKRI